MRTARLALVFGIASMPALLAAQTMPEVVTGLVLESTDGRAADGAGWRSWSVADPSGTLLASSPLEPVGTERQGGFYVSRSRDTITADALRDRVLAIELEAPDALGPDGRAGWLAVLRTQSRNPFEAAAPVQLTAIPRPTAEPVTGAMRVRWTAARSMGRDLGEADGLVEYELLRSPGGTGAYSAIARVRADSAWLGHLDVDGRPVDTYALRVVFAGGVRGLHLSRASTGAVTPEPCGEPSALDLRPSSTPFLLRRVGPVLRGTWEAGGPGFEVYRGTLASLWQGRRMDHATMDACRIGAAETDLVPGSDDAYFLVAARCGAEISSLGRGSDRVERPEPLVRCP